MEAVASGARARTPDEQRRIWREEKRRNRALKPDAYRAYEQQYRKTGGAEYYRRYRAIHRDRETARRLRWRESHLERDRLRDRLRKREAYARLTEQERAERRDYLRAWRAAHPDRVEAHKERQRIKRGSSARVRKPPMTKEEKIAARRAYQAKWRAANREKVDRYNARNRARRAAKRAVV
ncbi:hypothetical protein ASA1KI_39610 [Opitutales bacterium ASA1]|nr:hypothetical protein ASA1KI_39610 [Opitutales bacterium ASA1]